MKCPFCGVWTNVLSTRDSKRVRLCANGHRFPTTEVPAATRTLIVWRNRQVLTRVARGESITAVAKSFHCERTELSRVVRLGLPGYNTRSAGQLARWRARG